MRPEKLIIISTPYSPDNRVKDFYMTKGIPLSPREEKQYDQLFKEMEELKCRDVHVVENDQSVQIPLIRTKYS